MGKLALDSRLAAKWVCPVFGGLKQKVFVLSAFEVKLVHSDLFIHYNLFKPKTTNPIVIESR